MPSDLATARASSPITPTACAPSSSPTPASSPPTATKKSTSAPVTKRNGGRQHCCRPPFRLLDGGVNRREHRADLWSEREQDGDDDYCNQEYDQRIFNQALALLVPCRLAALRVFRYSNHPLPFRRWRVPIPRFPAPHPARARAL